MWSEKPAGWQTWQCSLNYETWGKRCTIMLLVVFTHIMAYCDSLMLLMIILCGLKFYRKMNEGDISCMYKQISITKKKRISLHKQVWIEHVKCFVVVGFKWLVKYYLVAMRVTYYRYISNVVYSHEELSVLYVILIINRNKKQLFGF